MGGSQSVAAVSREQVLRASEPMRLIADAALRVMLERITPKDLLDMANPSTCKNYILVIGGAFEQYFRSIDVVPVVRGTKDSKTIYFQRADVLTSSTPTKNPATDKLIQAQRQEICVALGYFFTRFFQIFAALALSVFDSEMVRQGSSVLGQLGEYKGLVGGPAGLGGPVLAGPGLAVRGGAAETSIGGGYQTFSFMRKYLNINRPNKIGYVDFYSLNDKPTVYFSIKKTDADQSSSSAFLAYELSRGEFGQTPKYLIVRINIRSNRITVDKVYIWKKASKEAQTEYKSDAFEDIYIELDDDGRVLYPVSGSPATIQNVLAVLLKHIIKYWAKFTENPTTYKYPEIGSIDETYEKYERAYNTGWGDRRTKTDTVPASIRPIYEAVSASYKPVAHCVARSLQLLQLDALRSMGGRAANSFICNYRFLAPNPTGLPRPGEAVTTSPGIAAMGTLYNVFVDGAPRLTDASKKEYLDLLRAFGAIFESPASAHNPRLDQIKDTWEKTLCGRIASSLGRKDATTQQITLGTKQIGIASEGVKKLWSRQLVHVREVDKLFALMFAIGRDRKINIHPNILKGGIPGLDAIAAAARQVLAKYYVDCEASYKETVGKIVGMPVVVPMTAAPKAVAAPAPARAAAAQQPAARAPVVPQQPQQLVQRQ